MIEHFAQKGCIHIHSDIFQQLILSMALGLMTDPQFSLSYWSPVLLLPVSKGSIQNSSLDCSGLVIVAFSLYCDQRRSWLTFPYFLFFPSINWGSLMWSIKQCLTFLSKNWFLFTSTYSLSLIPNCLQTTCFRSLFPYCTPLLYTNPDPCCCCWFLPSLFYLAIMIKGKKTVPSFYCISTEMSLVLFTELKNSTC